MSKEVSSAFPVAQDEQLGGAISRSLLMVDPTTVDLEPEPMPSDWILSGRPQARVKKIARSRDWTSHIVVWHCTAGGFKWDFTMDETIIVLSGEAVMIDDKGKERRLSKGEVGFFPAGTSCRWRIDDHFFKIGVLHEPLWPPVGFALKAWRTVLQRLGLAGKSPLG